MATKQDYQVVEKLYLNNETHCQGKILPLTAKQARHLLIAGRIKPSVAMSSKKKSKK